MRTNPLCREHLDDVIAAYRPGARHERVESERFHRFSYEDLIDRDEADLDTAWLQDDSVQCAVIPPLGSPASGRGHRRPPRPYCDKVRPEDRTRCQPRSAYVQSFMRATATRRGSATWEVFR